MSQALPYDGGMISPRRTYCRVPLALSWSHAGVRYRLTPWPEARVERCYGADWVAVEPAADAAAAAVNAGSTAWRSYLEFVPPDVRELVAGFRSNRLLALQVSARCPDLAGALAETPALAPFVAAHAALRGWETARWHELGAVFERAGVFGVLEWLGLPATRAALAVLRNLVSPDLAPGLLEPLRQALWRPQGIFALAQLPSISDRDVADACALAA